MNFNNIKEWIIPEGTVKEVKDSQNRVLWNKTPYIDYGYFYFEDITGEDNTIAIEKDISTAPTIEVFYSTDQTNWTSMGNTDDITPITATVPANGKLYLKATTNQWGAYVNGNRYNRFSILNSVNVGGNIMSLLYGDNYNNKTEFPSGSVRNFYHLFSACNIVSAENLVLPATTLTDNCYYSMFQTCTYLVTTPELPATTLANSCYAAMFADCASLTTAPALPATTLASNSYNSMFRYCSNLNKVTTYADVISANACLSNWLDSVSITGDFYNLGTATYPSGASGIPAGWTVHTSL